MAKSCEMCMMPMNKDPKKAEDERYCSYCFQDGGFRYTGDDLREFQRQCYQGMREHGISLPMAKFYAWMIRFAPYWKEKRYRR
ncbi:MAG: hypothetical protein ISN28_02705 [Ectothiorhodospiraceae bacterium AqS1]|nr:hypothetical protein [Ectothiorhodospiraceae bacterium AqS1]